MVSAFLLRPEITPILAELVAKSALPLASLETTFAVDSSGFRTTSFGDWRREKFKKTEGEKLQNIWLKAHVIAGTRTHAIPWVVVTEGHVNDTPILPELVNAHHQRGIRS